MLEWCQILFNTFPFYDPDYPQPLDCNSQCQPLPSFGCMLYIQEFSSAVYIEISLCALLPASYTTISISVDSKFMCSSVAEVCSTELSNRSPIIGPCRIIAQCHYCINHQYIGHSSTPKCCLIALEQSCVPLDHSELIL